MRGILICLLLTGCAATPRPASAPAPAAPAYEIASTDALLQLPTVVVTTGGELRCPGGAPILAGYITDADLAAPDDHISTLPAMAVDWDTAMGLRRDDASTIARLSLHIQQLQTHAIAVLDAARRGQLCGGRHG